MARSLGRLEKLSELYDHVSESSRNANLPGAMAPTTDLDETESANQS